MFGLIRSIIGSVLVIAGTCAIKKSKITHKRKWALLMSLGTVVLIFISCLFPIENILITFESPEKAFCYSFPSDIRLIVNGNETDFVVGQSNAYLILPKTEKGWKTSTGQEIKLVCSKSINKATVANIYKHKNYDDLYVVIYSIEGNMNEISDNVGSEFQSIKNLDYGNYYMYVAHINNIEKTYCITINGEEILLMEQ